MDNNTLILKVHVIIALLSLAIYLLRGLWMMTNNPAVTGKPALASASLSMLILLGTGAWLAFVSGAHGLDGFVVFKFMGLLEYIVLGVIALKPGLPRPTAIVLWVAGLGGFVFSYLVAKGVVPVLF